MENPPDAGAHIISGTETLTETLEELSDPLDLPGAEAQPLPAGTTLAPEDEGPFTVIRLLKEGFPLRLYQARQDDDEETVWLWERVGESASLLTDEGNLLREVRCPMFPRVQANFTFDGRCYLATESCSGETLAEQLCAGKLDPPRAVSILSQVAFALTKLHEAGFVHLGLRPGVIVPGRPTKVLDFSDMTRVGVTPARSFYHAGYSAPELLQKAPADVRSDIYSVGALLFHAVGGKPIAETGAELMAWGPETPVAGVPQVLGRCLGDKDTRYRSAAELHRDLVRLVKRLTPPVRYALGTATSIGLEPGRTTNQDAFIYCLGTLVCEEETESWLTACVADGMGGMEAGEAASEAVVRSLEAKARATLSARLLEFTVSGIARPPSRVRIAQLGLAGHVPGFGRREALAPQDLFIAFTPDERQVTEVDAEVLGYVQQKNLDKMVQDAVRVAGTDAVRARQTLQAAVGVTKRIGNAAMTRILQNALNELNQSGTISVGTRKTVALGGRTKTVKTGATVPLEGVPSNEDIRKMTGA